MSTNLPPPPAYNQLSVPVTGDDDCGQTCVAAVITALGVAPVTPGDVASVITGETTPAQLVALLARWEVDASVSSAADPDYYNIVLTSSNAAGVPTTGTGIGHWLLQYGPDNYLNPYGGLLTTYTSLPLPPSGVAAIVTVEMTPTTEELTMTLDVARLFVWQWYASILRRMPESQAAVDDWATQLAAPSANYEAVVTEFCSTPEARSKLA